MIFYNLIDDSTVICVFNTKKLPTFSQRLEAIKYIYEI